MEGDYRRAIKDINASGRAAMARAARIMCRMGTRQALDLSSRFFSWDFNDFTDLVSAGGTLFM